MVLDQDFLNRIVQDSQLKQYFEMLKQEFKNSGRTNIKEEISLIFENNRLIIEEYLDNHKDCKIGEPLTFCKQEHKGYEDIISYENRRFYRGTTHCAHWKYEHQYEEMLKQFTFIDYVLDDFSMSIGTYYQNLDIEKLFTVEQIKKRKDFFELAAQAITKRKMGKGIYLYGKPGIGKTTILKVLANTIAKQKKYSLAFINVANLVNLTKKSIGENSNKSVKLMDNLKSSDILFLDDIGSEAVTSWARDDLLLSLLSYRKDNKKLTFFTSNYSFKQLTSVYAFKKDETQIDKIKKERFLERLRILSQEFYLEGESLS